MVFPRPGWRLRAALPDDGYVRFRRDATPVECYQCEIAYQYARQAGQDEGLCEESTFYDMYQICANCIEDNTSSGEVRDYVEPKLGRFVDYCAGLTTLSSWASLGTASPTSTTVPSDQESTSAETTSQDETTKTASEEATASETVPTSVPGDVSSAVSTLDRMEQPTSSSVSESTDTGGSGRNPAWIAGPIVPSVVVAIALIGAGFWWYRRQKRTPKPPSSTEGGEGLAQSDKPQLHSECIPRPTQEHGGTMQAPMAQALPVSSYYYAELPVNEAPAHEMPTRERRGS